MVDIRISRLFATNTRILNFSFWEVHCFVDTVLHAHRDASLGHEGYEKHKMNNVAALGGEAAPPNLPQPGAPVSFLCVSRVQHRLHRAHRRVRRVETHVEALLLHRHTTRNHHMERLATEIHHDVLLQNRVDEQLPAVHREERLLFVLRPALSVVAGADAHGRIWVDVLHHDVALEERLQRRLHVGQAAGSRR